jgi:hypothetical protein
MKTEINNRMFKICVQLICKQIQCLPNTTLRDIYKTPRELNAQPNI